MLRSLLFVILLLLVSCKKKIENLPTPGTLVGANEVTTISKLDCIQWVDSADISNLAVYDVKLIEISYTTEYQGKSIKTSGMLFFPVGKDTIDFVTYCHGTIVPLKLMGVNDQIPTFYKGGKEDFAEIRNIGLTWASAGYSVFMPDYIGYDLTKTKEHPYVYYPELFKSIRDGDLAIKQYFKTLSNFYDDSMFLAGWSQGGGASLSAQRYFEATMPSEFNIKASLNLSGPYNFKRFIKSVFDHKDQKNDKINIYSWALYSLNKFSELNRPNDRYWSYPVFDQVSAFNPPSTVPSEIFNNFFIKQIVEGKDVPMNTVLERNSMISGWKPQAKVFLYHGNADTYVPYFNSEDCYHGLLNEGADIQLITYDGDSHYSVFHHYLIDALNQMNLLK